MTLRRRSSSGSMPSCRATVSIICSRDQRLHHPRAAVGAAPARVRVHGRRREPDPGDLVGPGEQQADEADGAAPGSRERRRRPRPARRGRRGCAPSASRAKLTVIRSSRACWPAIRFSRRSSIHFTGRPSRLPASTTATSSGIMNIFWPKPPPTSRITTRTRFSGRPRARDRNPRTPWAPWVDVCTTSSLAEPVPDRHHAAALHRHAQVAVLVERLGDDVGGAVEDGVELGIGAGRDVRRATLSDRPGCTGRAPAASAASWPTTASIGSMSSSTRSQASSAM